MCTGSCRLQSEGAFLTPGAIDTLDWINLCCGAILGTVGCFSSIPGLHPLEASGTHIWGDHQKWFQMLPSSPWGLKTYNNVSIVMLCTFFSPHDKLDLSSPFADEQTEARMARKNSKTRTPARPASLPAPHASLQAPWASFGYQKLRMVDADRE